ncbi:MAG TPA: hypothetical protein VD838_01795 [Anaeromyxobacteraceae bacterium]|nr:hypothetical protein [Anaeromyxobacteraceae bacterium]
MALSIPDATLDGALDFVAENCDKVTLCEGQPTTYEEANVTNALASAAVDPSDFSKADGDVSGRKLVLAAQALGNAAASGDADHYALLDTAASAIRAVLPVPAQAVTAGNPVTVGAVDVMEIADAVAE